MRDDLRQTALGWAEELLPAPRWRLELANETARRHRGTGRAGYRLRLRVWEPAGTACVRLLDAAPAVAFPFASDDLGEHEEVGEQEAGEDGRVVLDAALAAARAQWPGGELNVRGLARRRVRGGAEWLVRLERARRDGFVVVDLDSATGDRLGLLAAPLLRGSRRSAALTRAAAVVRAREQVHGLPDGMRLRRARLMRSEGSRVWRVHWEDETAGVAVTLNARTGRLCSWDRTLPVETRLSAFPARDEAARELSLAVVLQLGDAARLSVPVAGARAGRPVWFAVAQTPDGRLFRATLDRGRVDLLRRDAGAVARTA